MDKKLWVLLVDDEKSVLGMVRLMFERQGLFNIHAVTTAGAAIEFLHRMNAEERDTEIQQLGVIVTDIELEKSGENEKVNGIVIATQALILGFNAKIVICSGRLDAYREKHKEFFAKRAIKALKKPFGSSQLFSLLGIDTEERSPFCATSILDAGE